MARHILVVLALLILPGCLAESDGPLLDETNAAQPFPAAFRFVSADSAGSASLRIRRAGKGYEALDDNGAVAHSGLAVWESGVLILQMRDRKTGRCRYAFWQPDRDQWRWYPFGPSQFDALLTKGDTSAQFLSSNKFVYEEGGALRVRSAKFLKPLTDLALKGTFRVFRIEPLSPAR